MFRYPGQLTVAYLAGKRLQQANPILMLLFLVALSITLQEQVDVSGQVSLVVEQVLTGRDPQHTQQFEAAMNRSMGPALRIVGYGLPLLGVLMSGLAYRVLFQTTWLTSLVFALHNHMFSYTIGLVVMAP